MPTETKFICPSGASFYDLSGVFDPLNGGSSYGSATNYKVNGTDLTGIFYASQSSDDRPNFNTGFKLSNGTDLSTIFRRYGYIVDPVITSQPAAATRTTTQSVTFTATFNCLTTVSYQWKKDGVDISGASGSVASGTGRTATYTINSIAMGNEGNYSITLTGSSIVNSNNARLSISPRITGSTPSTGSYTKYYGTGASDTLSLSVTADGETSLSYQWYKNGSTLGSSNGAATANYSKTITNGDTGTYTCIVTNSYGNATTGDFIITASSGNPTISVQPTNQVVTNGTAATFSVSASANVTIGYQWKYTSNNADVVGQTSSSFTTGALSTANDNDSYYCNVYTAYGSVNTSSVSSKIKPYITSAVTVPSTMILSNGSSPVAVQCYALGSGTLSYSWYLDGVAVSGQQNQSANLTNGQQYVFTLNTTTDGTYTCKVTSNYDGTGTTSSGLLAAVNPFVTSQPSDATVNSGNNAVFTVGADGSGTLSYTWYRSTDGGSNYYTFGAANNYQYAVIGAISSYDGYKYYCIVSSSISGTSNVQSSTVTLTVNYAPVINSQPSSTILNNGNAASFIVSASGKPNPSYQWQRSTNGGSSWSNLSSGDETSISGITSTNLTFTCQGSRAGYQYRCAATNSVGTTYSSAATLNINPYIISQPSSTVAYAGNYAVFSVSAGGSATLSYQWYKSTNGGSSYSAISGATSSSHAEYTTSSSNGYMFYCIVSSNVSGTSTAQSSSATLTAVWIPTYATITGGLTTYSSGANVTLTHTNNDGNASIISRQWYYWDGTTYVAISGQTSSSIVFYGSYNGVPDDMGSGVYRYYYTIRLQNAAGYTDPQNDNLSPNGYGIYFDIQT